jgi:hypothetical protein
MKIWVDADACPAAIKEILYKASRRKEMELILVANAPMRTPLSPYIRFMRVTSGPDIADKKIIENITAGDLVITADIPLAAEVVKKGCHALSPRGEMFSMENIGARLSMRDFLDDLRSSGINTGGPAPLSNSDRMSFASQLDKLLTKSG